MAPGPQLLAGGSRDPAAHRVPEAELARFARTCGFPPRSACPVSARRIVPGPGAAPEIPARKIRQVRRNLARAGEA